VFAPGAPDGLGGQQAVLPQPVLVEQVFGPVAQRAAQPAVDRYPEAHLGAIEQGARHMLGQHLAQQPLALAATNLVLQRQRPGELDDLARQHRYPGLQTDRHRGAIDLHENVVGQVAQAIVEHHEVHL